MPHRSSDPQEQFNTVEDLLTRWLKERRELLGKYTEIAVAMDTEVSGEALQIRQDLPPAHFLVGLVALEAKDRRTAFSAFRSVVKLDPDHGAAWAQLARLYMSEGQVNKADAALRETLRIKPEDPLVLDLIGTTLSLMGEYNSVRSSPDMENRTPPICQILSS